MATLWKTENFSRGIHTKPARVEGGETYAADIENLQVDGDGFLRLRNNFKSVGPGGENITGLGATAHFLFLLRADGTLWLRPLDDLDTETQIAPVENLRGRLSVVSPFRTYAILTSEGPDKGYWIDLREGRNLQIYKLGIDPPDSDAFEVVQSVPPLDTEYTALVVYAVSYVREFESGSGEVAPDELFNGIESELSRPKYVFSRRPVGKTLIGPTVNNDVSWEWTDSPTILDGEGGRDGETIIISVVDDQGRNHRQEILDALPRLPHAEFAIVDTASGVEQITGQIESVPETIDTHLRITLTSRSGADLSDGDGFYPQFHGAATALGFSVADRYYPALIQNLTFPLADSQITGINIYRSRFFRDDNDFERIKQLIDSNDSKLDLSTLEFKKIYTVSKTGVPAVVSDGVRVETDDEGTIARIPYTQILNAIGRTPRPAQDYNWDEKDIADVHQNKRLPPEVRQIHYHAGRIFAPAGDRLVYSDYRGTTQALWAFPATNEIRRVGGGRIEFCASHREVLLLGASDGLYRLEGVDPLNFKIDQISGTGPLDGYSWGVMKDTLGFVGSKGLYVTDAASVEFVSDESLDGFFDAQVVKRGSVVFFTDNTILFFVGLQPVGGSEIVDSLFLFDDRHWVRWSGESVTQFSSIQGQIYIAGADTLRHIQRGEGENTDENLSWAWESNLIHGQEQGAGNLTKRFAELLLSAAAGTDITLKTWLDTQGEPTERQFETRDDLYFQRIPIERIGKRLRFRLEGTGPVTIRGLQIEGEV